MADIEGDILDEIARRSFDVFADIRPSRNQRGLRYWTSFEEMRLIELWRRYRDEVISLDKNLPIFRTIVAGMREYGFIFNPQETRRKIYSFKKRYMHERRLLEQTPNSKSDWDLYDLVHCVLTETNPDVNKRERVIQGILAKVPPRTTPDPLAGANISPFYTTNTTVSPPLPTVMPLRSLPIMQSGNIIRRRFNMAHLEQLRADNRRLAEQRDNERRRLENDERRYRLYHEFFTNWQRQQELALLRFGGGPNSP